MSVQQEINTYISSQPEAKRNDMLELHKLILALNPTGKLWFLDGKNSENKVVTNPNIGYGFQTLHYADGSSKPFYQVGFCATSSGISIYILSIADKTYLSKTYSSTIGKASITGYCIKIKNLKTIDLDVLKAALQDGFNSSK